MHNEWDQLRNSPPPSLPSWFWHLVASPKPGEWTKIKTAIKESLKNFEAIGVERKIYLMAFMRMRFFRVVLLFSCAYPRPATDPSLKTLTLGGNK